MKGVDEHEALGSEAGNADREMFLSLDSGLYDCLLPVNDSDSVGRDCRFDCNGDSAAFRSSPFMQSCSESCIQGLVHMTASRVHGRKQSNLDFHENGVLSENIVGNDLDLRERT